MASRQPGAVKAQLPKTVAPQLALLVDHPPEGDDWLHEVKFDGYRILAFVWAGGVRLVTRNGNDWTATYPGIADALKALPADAVLDGEVVVLDKRGQSDFQALQALFKDKAGARPVYYVFDLPHCGGFDLTRTPLIARKRVLKALLTAARLGREPQVLFSDHVRGGGDAAIGRACAMYLEGIVSKRADAGYVAGRDASWVKSKCQLRQELVILGSNKIQGRIQSRSAHLLLSAVSSAPERLPAALWLRGSRCRVRRGASDDQRRAA